MTQTYTRNIVIKNLPMSTNNILNTLARLRGQTKIIIVRAALIEYAENHVNEITGMSGILTDEETEE